MASGKSLSRPPKVRQGLPSRSSVHHRSGVLQQPDAATCLQLQAVQADSNKVFYVKEGHGGPESAAVIFPIYMQQRVDGVLATAFVQVLSHSGKGHPAQCCGLRLIEVRMNCPGVCGCQDGHACCRCTEMLLLDCQAAPT